MLNASRPSRSRSSSAPSTIRSLDSPRREPGPASCSVDIGAEAIVHLYRTVVRNAGGCTMRTDLRRVAVGAACAASALAAAPALAGTGSRQSAKAVFVEQRPGLPSALA